MIVWIDRIGERADVSAAELLRSIAPSLHFILSIDVIL